MKKMEPNMKSKKESRLEKVIVFMLVVLISLLSFSVGVISGKGLSDKEYALKSMDQKYNGTAQNEDGTAGEPAAEGDLTEEEIQQLANAAVQAAEKNSGDMGSASETTTASTKAPASVTSKTATKNEAHDERAPSSVPPKPSTTDMQYTVQVASYPSLKDAESLSANLAKKGLPAFPFKVSINGQDWYRVSVGSFKTKKDAMDYQADLKKQGVVKDSVVQKLSK